ncbi:MAG TPA: phage portal protein [Nocardioides sp.]
MFGQEASTPQIVERHTLHFSTIRPEDLIGLTPDGEAPHTPTDRWAVSRGAAIRVPAVKRGRDLVAGTIGTLPMTARFPDGRPRDDLVILRQPDPSRGYAKMIADTVDDLIFYSVAWWHITSRSSVSGLPVAFERLDPRSVSLIEQAYNVNTPYSTTAQTWAWDDDPDIIRFDAITDPLLKVAAGTIRNALRLEAAAAMYSDGTPPAEWFTPTDGVDPADEDVVEFMAAWDAARRTHTSGYVPAAFQRNTDGFNPDQLQMAESRQHAALEIARFMGLDGEDINVPTTSRTYFNAFDRQQQRIRSTLALYFVPIEQRLSMDDVTPRGTRVLFDLSELLRADDMTRFQAYAAGRAVGVYEDVNAVRRAEKLPELPPGVAPEPVTAPAANAPAPKADDTAGADTAIYDMGVQ